MSLDAQRARIEAWSDATGATLTGVVEDGGVSGTLPVGDRPGGAEIAALLDARRANVDAVVVVRLDRLGRDAAETLAVLKRFADGTVGLVSIADRLDLSTPQGRAMAGVAAVFSQLERDLIAQRTAERARRAAVSAAHLRPCSLWLPGYEGPPGSACERTECCSADAAHAIASHELCPHCAAAQCRWRSSKARRTLARHDRQICAANFSGSGDGCLTIATPYRIPENPIRLILEHWRHLETGLPPFAQHRKEISHA